MMQHSCEGGHIRAAPGHEVPKAHFSSAFISIRSSLVPFRFRHAGGHDLVDHQLCFISTDDYGICSHNSGYNAQVLCGGKW